MPKWIGICLLLVCSWPEDVRASLRTDLQKHYSNIAGLKSDVTQEKSGKYLAMPIKSTCKLEWKKNVIHWKTIKPVSSEIIITNGAISVRDADGQESQMKQSSPEIAALIQFLQKIFSLDFSSLDKDFEFSENGRVLIARARPNGAVKFIHTFTLTFDSDLNIQNLVFDERNGKTMLTFQRVNVQRIPQGSL